MPKKARDNTSKKARGKERGRTNEQGPKKKGRDAPTSRYGSLCGFSNVVDVLFRKWHARNVRSLPGLCGELPTIVEEDVCSMDQQLLASLEDLKQNIRRREDSIMSAVNANATQNQAIRAMLVEQSSLIQSLAAKVEALEGKAPNVSNEKTPPAVVVDGNISDDALKQEVPSSKKGRSFNMLADVAVAFCGEASCVSEEVLSGRCPNPCKRKLEFVTFNNEDMNILYSIKQRYIGSPFAYLSHNRYHMYGEECPFFLDLAFRPPPGMPFVGMELSIAAYIFARAGEDSEVLYQDNHCDGSRLRFMSLVPGNELYDDVLNMVVGMCNGSGGDTRKWWLPTTFSQMILDPRQYNQPTMDYIKQRYMGKADEITRVRGTSADRGVLVFLCLFPMSLGVFLSQIYIPMHVLNHWYLMIIDLWDKKLVYIDSLKSEDMKITELRVSRMKEVVSNYECYVISQTFLPKSNQELHVGKICRLNAEGLRILD
ncbi:hypothetical protein PIB30_025770 [Stylosanthes scabra]|uniref:Ubiquitin-like protease family profile domain-containing protein n=1 Tax=Stylosanthes scabra TaxID=79078 RepID=A0ABU6SA54_9FABA|nr:hypothetical protein [Stylosanthes scabra]